MNNSTCQNNSKLDSVKNTWIESSIEAIEYLISCGANISSMFTNKEMVLKNKILAVNEHGNILGFNRLPKTFNLKHLKID